MSGLGGMRGDKRVDLGDAVLARLETHGNRFEIIVDPKLAWAYKQGEKIDLREVIRGDTIFEDALRSKKAAIEALEEAFGTTDELDVARQILEKGSLQLTAEQRREMVEKRLRQVIDIIVRNCINPKTGLPHPPARIEAAMEEAAVTIDSTRSAEEQVRDIVKALQPVIPIRMEIQQLAVKVPPDFAPKAYGTVERIGHIAKDEWQSDGSWIAVVEVPGGLRGELIDALNNLTRGRAEIKILKKESI
ncbi:MAG: ribosome assembly factor SBDS [Candidatus Thorarchaeota archaeon]